MFKNILDVSRSIRTLQNNLLHAVSHNIVTLENPEIDLKKSGALIDEAIVIFDALISKIHQKEVADKKAHFKAISSELETQGNALLEKLNAL